MISATGQSTAAVESDIRDKPKENRHAINENNHNKQIALHVAVKYRHRKVVLVLLGVRNPEAEPDRVRIAKEVIAEGVNELDKNDQTALHLAVERKDKDILQNLLKAGARADISGKTNLTALGMAAERNLDNIVEILLKNNVQIDAVADEKVLDLVYRRLSNTGDPQRLKDIQDILCLLLTKSTAAVGGSALRVLYQVMELHSTGDPVDTIAQLRIVQCFLNKGANMNSRVPNRSDNCTFIELAELRGHTKLVKLMRGYRSQGT
ncbi:ankyrin repeat-containing domain protein [Hypoxylon trugodes]|uniref:ankyrin repeat-containing domain protein n=1 Tax=Hypoxylon trugodes TaxID=326681 RepID=UPI00218F73BC|nr:ankyrin repeat-containing domain protein [Hypoxylon trugodes]KAI1385694.1 ankyrin repeat-containing domain protein [Hypoxylon trugodes]